MSGDDDIPGIHTYLSNQNHHDTQRGILYIYIYIYLFSSISPHDEAFTYTTTGSMGCSDEVATVRRPSIRGGITHGASAHQSKPRLIPKVHLPRKLSEPTDHDKAPTGTEFNSVSWGLAEVADSRTVTGEIPMLYVPSYIRRLRLNIKYQQTHPLILCEHRFNLRLCLTKVGLLCVYIIARAG